MSNCRRSTVASRTTGVPASSAARAAHPVDLDVIGVAVAPRGVVHGERVSPDRSQQGGQPGGRHLDVDAGEGVPVAACPAVHARIVVPEQVHFETAERGGGAAQFVQPARGEVTGRAGCGCGGQSLAAGRGGDEDHPVSLGRGARQGAGGQQGLIVGMGVKGHQREARHGTMVPRRAVGRAASWEVPRR